MRLQHARPLLVAATSAALAVGVLAPVGGAGAAPAADGPAQDYLVVLDQASAEARKPQDAVEQRRLRVQQADELRVRDQIESVGEVTEEFGDEVPVIGAELTPSEAAEIARDPAVVAVTPDREVSLSALETARNVPWGLDRIDQRSRALNRAFSYASSGAGVTAYVVDTGLRASHREFTGRVEKGASFVRDGRGTSDCEGHGTHVAGTVVGRSSGVARRAKVKPVRVLDCRGYGTTSGVLRGLQWVLDDVDGPSVVNMSLGGDPDPALDAAVRALVSKGVTVVVAAGNESMNACRLSPSRVREAIVVGASDRNDRLTSFTNSGPCVQIYAPGHQIASADYRSASARVYSSGSSMAAPHVAGAAAMYLENNSCAAPSSVRYQLVRNSTALPSRHRLLFTRFAGMARTPSNELLCNGGFEQGPRGWRLSPVLSADAASTGGVGAYFGGYEVPTTEAIQQRARAHRAGTYRLGFDLAVQTAHPTSDGVRDRLVVRVLDGTREVLRREYSNLDAARAGFARHSADIKVTAGRPLTVRIVGVSDRGPATDFFVDRVSLRRVG